ncbi:MAG TPA: J domain-containing protein [Pyrinomonadaceae bacterium]|nr:J domain-containing protein [Pyrinomonadaceae bacterium]
MSSELGKAYDVLGVKPGVSNRELKAAHRDLAKVWHPDRFQHDPRLQDKAQEKLKEINEAYDQLISGKVPKPVSPVSPPASQPARSGGVWKWAAILLVFVAVFAFTSRSLLQRRVVIPEQKTAQPVQPELEARTKTEAPRKVTRDEAAPTVVSSSSPIETQPAAVATVTVTIDPQSGLLAKADCPVRSRMTYPRGSEPSGHCNINHTPPPKESRLKSIAEKLLPQKGTKSTN